MCIIVNSHSHCILPLQHTDVEEVQWRSWRHTPLIDVKQDLLMVYIVYRFNKNNVKSYLWQDLKYKWIALYLCWGTVHTTLVWVHIWMLVAKISFWLSVKKWDSVYICCVFLSGEDVLFWSMDQYNNVWKGVVEKSVDCKGLILRQENQLSDHDSLFIPKCTKKTLILLELRGVMSKFFLF